MPGSESREDLAVEDAWNYLEERFKVRKKDLEGFEIVKRSGDFWLVSAGDFPDLEFETEGIRFLRDTGKYLKPTTYGLQILDSKVSSARVEVSAEELEVLLDGDMIERELDVGKGYVAIVYDDKVIGCGLYKGELASSRISRGRAEELRNIMV
ncbi:MAG: hypothetical protein ABEK10_04925 [Candidatus Nanosalina sp.]